MALEPLDFDLSELESFPVGISSEVWSKLSDCVSKCMIPTLSKSIDEFFDDKQLRNEILSFIPALAHNINNLLRILNVIEEKTSNVPMDTDFFLRVYYLVDLMKAKEFWHNECYFFCLTKFSNWFEVNTYAKDYLSFYRSLRWQNT